jgi:hypothetical protein
VVVSLDVQQPRTWLDVQQDVVPVKKQIWSVLVSVPVASAQIYPTRIQTGTICQVMTMMVAYYSNLMAMTLDSMAYLKNNDGNARRYYLHSAVDQYLFTHSIFSFGSTVDKVNVWSWLRSWNAPWWGSLNAPWRSSKYKRKSQLVCARKARLNRSLLF